MTTRKKNFRTIAILIMTVFLSVSFLACNGGDEGYIHEDEPRTVYVMPERFTAESDRSPRNGEKRAWNSVSSYFINMGVFHPEMPAYDVAMINPAAITDEELDILRKAGTWIIAVVDAGEDDSIRTADGMGVDGVASYYKFFGGMPIRNPLTGGYFVDAGSRVWRDMVTARIHGYLDAENGRGFDGILLRNLNTIIRFPETANGMAGMIRELRQTFPEAKIIGDGGFDIFPTINSYLDAALFESFYTFFDARRNSDTRFNADAPFFVDNRLTAVNIINAVRQYNYMPVFVLEYFTAAAMAMGINMQIIYNRAYEYAFIPYVPLGGRPLDGDVTGHNLFPRVPRGTRSLLAPEVILPIFNGDRSEYNLAYAGNGGIITVSSIHPGYVGGQVLNDGIIGNEDNEDRVDWSRIAWASAEEPVEHYVIIEIRDAAVINNVLIHWAIEGGSAIASRHVTVEALIEGVWVEVGRAVYIPMGTRITAVELDNTESITSIRILQQPGHGSLARGNLMWITEIMVYAN